MKNTKLLNVTLIILLVGLIVGGFLYIKTYQEGLEPKKLSIDELVIASVDIPEITTNLKSKNYIKIQFKVQTDSEDAATELTKRQFQVNNLAIQELSDITREELDGKEGKIKLETLLKGKFNELLKDGEVKQVYITSYIIQ